jgi:NADPH:quinone reductase-like Zn-dependent oxidoreductase
MIGPMALGFTAPLLSRFVGRRLGVVLTKPNNPDLVVIQDLLKTGKVKPVNEVSAAIRYLEEGHARGKVVITVE